MDDLGSLAALLQARHTVLLDFDGPVCDVFAGHSAAAIAAQLRDLIGSDAAVRDQVPVTDDPLELIRFVGEAAPQLAASVEVSVRQAEVEAVTSAVPTRGAAGLLRACQRAGRRVAIVSNNSADAISAYLDIHGLAELVQHVQGRDPQDPRRMKPDPYSLQQSLIALTSSASDAVFVGDSATDIDAGHAVGVPVIAYVNKPQKAQLLQRADVSVVDMQSLADVVQSLAD